MQNGTAGERKVKSHVATGCFEASTTAAAVPRAAFLPKINRPSNADPRRGEGSLHGALAPDTGRTGGLTNKPVSALSDDFVHIPGYGGHRPEGWTSHYERKHFGRQHGVDSKAEAHVKVWGRPAMTSGMGFSGNIKLAEGPPKLNGSGLFHSEVEDEIDRVARTQRLHMGETAFRSLRAEEVLKTTSASAQPTLRHEAVALEKSLSRHPPGTRKERAHQKDLTIFQGFYPSHRHIPGYDGHLPGGVRL